MNQGGIMELSGVDSGEVRGAYAQQSVLDAEALEVEIQQAFKRNLPVIDVKYISTNNVEGTIRLLLVEETAQNTDAGAIYSFILESGSDSVHIREVTILIPKGGGRALISLPY